jgi:replicative DNA helicase
MSSSALENAPTASDTLVALVADVFAGRFDVYAQAFPHPHKKDKVSYAKKEEPLTNRVLLDHLEGRRRIGVYPLVDNYVRWFAVDYDAPKELQEDGTNRVIDNPFPKAWEEAMAQAEVFEREGLFVYLERSRSGKGVHLWGFFEEPVEAMMVLKALKPLLLDATAYDRFYPVQSEVEEGGYGNLIALPFHGKSLVEENTAFLNTDTLEPIGPESFLNSIQFNNRYVIEELALKAPKDTIIYSGSAHIRSDGDYDANFSGRPAKPIRGFLKMISEYGNKFMHHAVRDARSITQEEWWVAIGQCTCFQHGREAAHLISQLDPDRYSAAVTDETYDRLLQHPPHGCNYIHAKFPNYACSNCDMKAPYHIASKPILQLVSESKATLARPDWNAAYKRVRDRNSGAKQPGITWGLPEMDQITRLRKAELIVIGARPSIGKAFTEATRVMTPTGWARIDALHKGDEVIGRNGKACNIVGVFPQGEIPVFKVTFSDGASVECCDEHQWFTLTRNDIKRGRKGSVKTLAEIRASLRMWKDGRANHAVPLVEPIEFATAAPLPVDPYVLGAWLGDGDWSSSLRLSNSEKHVRERVCAGLPEEDYMDCAHVQSLRIVRRVPVTESGKLVGAVTRAHFKAMGLEGTKSATKFIPEPYLRASITDRIALLQGLCDTDGHVCVPGGFSVEVCTASPRLAAGIKELVQGLGGIISETVRATHYTVKGVRTPVQASHRLCFHLDNGVVPVSSPKHLEHYRSEERIRQQRRWIVAIEPAGVKSARCISVDASDSLYVVEGAVVTHNTAFMVDRMYDLARRGVPVLGFSAETGEESLTDRMMSRVANVDSILLRGEGPRPLTEEENKRVAAAILELEKLPLFLNFSATRPDQILDLIEETILVNRIPLDQDYVIFFDFLQFGNPTDGGASEEYGRLTKFTAELKFIAKILQQAFVVFSQLKRDTEGDEKPDLDAFKGTGKIEETADVALVLSGERTSGSIAQRWLHGLKQREGIVGWTIKLLMHQATSRFEAVGSQATAPPKDLFAAVPDAIKEL